jgi:hemerythrin-like domain-containing protein
VGEKVGTVPEVLNRLHKEHADLARLLDILDRQLALFTAGKPADYDTIGAILQYCMEYPDAVHHPKEDLVYGRLRGRDPALAAEVGDLEEDHRGLAEMTRTLADLIERALAEEPVDRDQVRSLTGDFIRRYRHHIAREELHVFPAAKRILSEDDWIEIDGQLGDREDPLFGEVVADYFQSLRDDIDQLAAIAQGD